MSEKSTIGSINAITFFLALITLPLQLIQCRFNFVFLPTNFWKCLFVLFICVNVLLYLLFTGFKYKTLIRSYLLGVVFTIGIHVSIHFQDQWSILGWYLCTLSIFHFSEFVTIAWCNPSSLSLSSFILNHSNEYWIALAASWFEFFVEAYFWPGIKSFKLVSWVGFCLCFCGELLRKTAMFTAATNFNHLVQMEKEENHQLITHGVYAWCRHPSYLGWFLWSIGTQLLLLNPVCVVAYTIVSWNFFRERILLEEWCLLQFFQEDYVKYRQSVGTGLPFIEGLICKPPSKES